MRKHVFRHFHFTKLERRGLETVFVIAFLGFCIPAIFSSFEDDMSSDFSHLEKQVGLLEKAAAPTPKVLADPYPFNPNTASYDDFIALGLNQKIANRILNYRNKGGKFFKKEDFKKMYGLPISTFERLRPFIVLKEKVKNYEHTKTAGAEEREVKKEPFVFNPNAAAFKDFCDLGFSKRTAHSIINYREKGGVFYKKSDLKKIYTLDSTVYNSLESFIDLPEKRPQQFVSNKKRYESGPQTYAFEKKVKPTILPININEADEAMWMSLAGIGPSYAARIVKYRDRMGGFTSKNQVAEVYGLPDSTFQKIVPFLVESPILYKININLATKDEIGSHPYISRKQAGLIILYRQQHGAYDTLDQLLKIKVLNDAWLNKLRPYLET